MDDSLVLTVDDDADQLLEIVTRCILLQVLLVGDDLEEVFVKERSLHHQQETVVVFPDIIVQILDDSLNI